MKIIGETEKDGFLISASKDEIANLFGCYSKYQLDDGLEIKPGVEINVKGAYEKLFWLERRNAEFETLHKALIKAAKELEKSKSIFSKIESGEIK